MSLMPTMTLKLVDGGTAHVKRSDVSSVQHCGTHRVVTLSNGKEFECMNAFDDLWTDMDDYVTVPAAQPAILRDCEGREDPVIAWRLSSWVDYDVGREMAYAVGADWGPFDLRNCVTVIEDGLIVVVCEG